MSGEDQGVISTTGVQPGSDDQESERTCWICFATESENQYANWLHPCQCSGSTMWVHESCLYRWIDEKQNGNARMKVACMQCRAEYIILFPKINRCAAILESCQDMIRYCSPFVAASAFLGSVYWTAVTYGGITVLQVFGQQRGMEMMEKGKPLFLLVGLPFIPVVLILSRLIRWEDAILRLWNNRQSIVRNLPIIKWLFGARIDEIAVPPIPDEPLDLSRIFCGAILLPTISAVIGRVVFRSVATPLHRTLFGGLTYIVVKGIFKIYLRQKQYLSRTRRHIVDYNEENVRIYVVGGGEGGDPRYTTEPPNIRQVAGSEEDDDDDEDEDGVAGESIDDDTFMLATYQLGPTIVTSESRLDELDPNDIRENLVITVPDRPFTLYLNQS